MNIERIYPLSPMQSGMFFHHLLHEKDGAYMEQMMLTITGEINATVLEESFNALIKRHEVLRASFIYKETKNPRQIILSDRTISINFIDLSGIGGPEQEKYLKDYRANDREQGFDLTRDPLMRVGLFKLDDEQYEILWSFHHILMDGWCLGIVFRELLELYQARLEGRPALLEPVISYGEYIKWLEKQDLEESLAYWKKYLNEYEEIATLPYGSTDKSMRYSQKELEEILDHQLSEKLSQIGRRYKVTLNTVFQVIWGIVLQRYNRTDDVVFGAVVSGRPAEIKGIESMVGLFINTVPVRITCEQRMKFSELLQQVQGAALEGEKYNYSPLYEVQAKSQLGDDLLNHIMIFENYPMGEQLAELGDLDASGFEIKQIRAVEQTNYNLNFTVKPGKQLSMSFNYNSNKYSEEDIRRTINHIKQVIEVTLENPEILIEDIEIVSEEEKQLLKSFNTVGSERPLDKTIRELFEERVKKQPNAIAVTYGEESISYSELDRQANILAYQLRKYGAMKETVVGLMADRSLEMVIGILGVLKAGAAYVPLDPGYPNQRLNYILEDSSTNLLLTQCNWVQKIDSLSFTGKVLLVEDLLLCQDQIKSSNFGEPGDLAYIIYTSGTSGRPKGTLTTNANITRVTSNTNYIEITRDDKVLSVSNFAFDGFTFDLFGALLNGAQLILASTEMVTNPNQLIRLIKSEHITIIFVTTALFNLLAEYDAEWLKSVRKVLFGGEASSVSHVQKVIPGKAAGKVIHVYGPTETTVFATYYQVENILEGASTVPIGKPVNQTDVYILGPGDRLQPIGVAGELCIGGAGVGRGYLNRPELTAEKFVENPYRPGERMYRTGDLARWLPDGNIEFLGRMDHQVKIRGYRIELGEIENQLLKHPKVREAVVIAQLESDGQSQALCAYVVGDSGLKSSILREYLSQELPEYMIPSYFIALEELPLTPNGKVDRKALPKPEAGMASGRAYEAPSNEIESQMAEIWQGVLGREKVGLNDHFFELGGHSLKATVMASAIHKQFDVEIPLKQIFKTPTMRELAAYTAEADRRKYRPIERIAEREWYPVSSAQKRLLILQQLEGGDASYNMPSVFLLEGDLDVACLEQALVKMTERHEALRTSFEWINGEPVQRIHPRVEIKLGYSQASFEEGAELTKSFVRPFDLSKAPLMRAELIQISEEKHLFMLDMHHVVSDGVSMGIFMDELSQMYDGKELGQPRIQYKDYSEWQQARFQSEEMEKQKAYWLEHLGGELPILDLPTDYSRPSVQSFEGDRIFFRADETLTDSLKRLGKEYDATLYMVLLAAYKALLSRYSGQEDIIVGAPVAGRLHKDCEQVIGLFVNTLPVRSFPNKYKTFETFLLEVKETMLAAIEHQEYPLEELISLIDIPRDLSRNPLFCTLFVLQNIELIDLKLESVSALPFDIEFRTSKFDMSVEAVEGGGQIRFSLEYATKIFDQETIKRFSEHYLQILREIIRNPKLELANFHVIDSKEELQLLDYFNNTAVEYPHEKTVQQLFEEQVERTPDNIAVVYGKEQITYKELNLRANRLAYQLREYGMSKDDVVGLLVDRSLDMIAGILGILKAGGSYLPLDPDLPQTRIKYMFEDSGAKILLKQLSINLELITLGSRLVINFDSKGTTEIYPNPEILNDSSDLAYVMYTSGSTGIPKGVMVEHRNINRLVFKQNHIQVNNNDRILQSGSFGFDATTFEIFGVLLNGATLYIISKDELLDSEKLELHINEYGITMMWLTSSLFNHLSEEKPEIFHSLKRLIVGGEALSPKHINRVLEKTNDLKIINGYGPTESTTFSTCLLIDNCYSETIPIGKPISNTQVYILSIDGQLQPIGIAGELCIGGAGVARGYLNQPELTAEKFVENPYRPGERMYRTGDVARWLPDGNIEFLGRIDHQVKIRGYRIEPGEIENQLLKHPKVREAVVIAQLESDGQSQALCAYVVGDSGLKSSILREYLSQELPEYMIPSYFIALEELPLTPNGKVDRKALPKPEAGMASGRAYEAPSNEIESQMAEIWQGVLGREKVGLNDHFFELGGDSIKGIQVCARLYKHGWKLEMKHLFQYPVLRDACTQVVPLQRKAEQGLIEGEVSLLPIQQWFFEQNLEEAEHWNQAMMLQGKPRFEEKSLEEALRKLVEHHDGLRTVFSGKGQEAKGYNLGVEEGMVNLAVVDLTEEEDPIRAIKEQAEEAQRNFDIEKGPLFRAKVFRTQTEDHLLLVAHHLVIDGVSWRILLEDLAIAYEQVSQGQPVGLQEKTDSVKEWSKGLRNYAISKELLKEVPYWREMEQSTISTLPKDSEPQSEAMKYNGVASIQLSRKDTVLLLEEVNRAYNTEINDLLLTALAQTVQKWTGESAMAVNMEGHGREEIIDSLTVTRTVGWYTSMYPVVLEPTSNADVGMQLKQVKETLRQVPKKGVGYGILRYLTPMEEREGLTFTLKPEISFNYLGQFDADLNTSLFKRSPYETGQTIGEGNQRLYEIDIVGMVDNGRMALNFNYNTDTYRPETMEEIAASYKEQLLILIYHCVNQTVAEVTPSDLGDIGLTLEDIEELTREIAITIIDN